jgi:hypothetical protein
MDFFYDGQIRRYVTQFMRMFIGFQYRDGDGDLKSVPVSYGNLTKQVAQIIRENSENKLPSVPKIACYITGLEYDRNRLADPTFISKLNIRERDYDTFDDSGSPEYLNTQGAGYTVERLMPTPFRLTMRADIWTSSTDQKLQLLEQILVLFNPSLEVQTTDNYIDWTSLSVVELTAQTFSSRQIPQGTEVDIDIASLDFEMPIYISPPVKVKKLGVVQNIIMNMFNDDGQIKSLNELAFNEPASSGILRNSIVTSPGAYGVLLLSGKTVTGVDTGTYYLSAIDPSEVVTELNLGVPIKSGERIDWNKILPLYGNYKPGISQIRFTQPGGYELIGTFSVNELDSSYLDITFIEDTIPTNSSDIPYITGIVDPYTFNPVSYWNGLNYIPNATRYLILENIGNSLNSDGPDAWKNGDGTDFVANANDIIQWNSTDQRWSVIFDSQNSTDVRYLQNSKTLIQYKWDGYQWVKSFEGEYSAGYWSFDLNP